MVIIRPRGYDFLYSREEMEAMIHDIHLSKDLGADGVVIGCLKPDGTVDVDRVGELIQAAGNLDITFHRAFDMTRDLPEALEDIIGLGVKRILSSGGHPDVTSGTRQLAALVKQSAGRASIMPGGGVSESNIGEIAKATGAREMHLSARHLVAGGMTYFNRNCHMGSFSRENEYEWREASEEKIRMAKANLTNQLSASA